MSVKLVVGQLIDAVLEVFLLTLLISQQLKVPLVLLSGLLLVVWTLPIFKPDLPSERLYVALRVVVEENGLESVPLTHCTLS